MIIKRGTIKLSYCDITPYEVEYEKIVKNLLDSYQEKNNPKDLRKNIKTSPSLSIIYNPQLVFEPETNMFSVYHQDDIPYSSSSAWIGGIYD